MPVQQFVINMITIIWLTDTLLFSVKLLNLVRPNLSVSHEKQPNNNLPNLDSLITIHRDGKLQQAI